MRKTTKMYYTHQYAKKIQSNIVKIDCKLKFIELDRTIAFPEGGGQESDHCIITHNNTGNEYCIKFVKRMYGKNITINDGKFINVEGVVQHYISEENSISMDRLNIGDEVTVEIDALRREMLTISHSASHLLYTGIKKVREDAIPQTIGCHIKEGQARFDFSLNERFSEQDIKKIQEVANKLVEEDHEINMYSSDTHPDARFWECHNNIIPCGGTHLKRTGAIGQIRVKRRSIGKGKERVICFLESPTYSIDQYKNYV